MDISGEMIVEYMLFNLRRGQVPKEKEFKHFLEPAKR